MLARRRELDRIKRQIFVLEFTILKTILDINGSLEKLRLDRNAVYTTFLAPFARDEFVTAFTVLCTSCASNK